MNKKLISQVKKLLITFEKKFSKDIESIYIYGSAVTKDDPNDVDILVVVKDDVNTSSMIQEIAKIRDKNKLIHIQLPKELSFWWKLILEREPWVIESLKNCILIKDSKRIVKEVIELVEKEIVYNKEEKAERLLQRSQGYLLENRMLLLKSISLLSEAATECLQTLLIFDDKVILDKNKIIHELETNYVKKIGQSVIDAYKEIVDFEEKMEKGVLSEFTVENLDYYKNKIEILIQKVDKILRA